MAGVQLGLVELWRSLGIKPAALMGSSVGEWTAACVAEVMCLEDTIRLIAEKGRLIDDAPAGASGYVDLPVSQVQELAPRGLEVAVVANDYSTIVSGSYIGDDQPLAPKSDFIEQAPEPVHPLMCTQVSLHMTALALRTNENSRSISPGFKGLHQKDVFGHS